MDYLDEAKACVVEAMNALEDALVSGLPAQSPSAEIEQVESGIDTLARQVDLVVANVKKAKAALKRAKTG